ncbi:hypothetical protein ACOCEA_11965 [Maribacter sp. CXY002]|uniref:hypothetical protein n=1 Tax=Maribacter luteocoastalis TaxID=3407671 RepID=UPI003B674221
MKKIISIVLSLCWVTISLAKQTLDYTDYHQGVVNAETFIADEKYKEALKVYEDLFDSYDFVFLREYQIATQLALYLGDRQKAKKLLIEGIKSGWTIKSIRKNNYLDTFRASEDWKTIKNQYRTLNVKYNASINHDLKNKVKKMYSKDQRKALGALFRFSSKAQDRYAERKFAPHSADQMKLFLEILDTYGYPGEKLVGKEYWMSTILSHHNSISTTYNRNDTLYRHIQPKLKRALEKGEISAFSFAMIEEWYRAVVNLEELPTYGILDAPLQKDLEVANSLRKEVYLRSIETHNKLVTAEEKTGMDFYLDSHPWTPGRIEIR